MNSPNIFLSHSGPDKAAAIDLKRRLLASPDAQAAGLKVWLDVEDLDEGKPWQAQLEAAIGAASAFAVIVGSNGICNWVRAETDLALSRAIKDESFRIIPILQDGGSESLTPFVKRYHAIRDPLNDPDALQRLLRAALGLDKDGLPVLTDDPFPGLRSMSEDWADRFFGRRSETDEVLALMRRHRAVTIVADSGAGKSSLAMAGVGHAWRGGALRTDRPHIDDQTIWHVVTMRPADNPIERMRDAIQSAAGQLDRDQAAIASLRQSLTTDPSFALLCGLDPASTHTLLIIDQAEELVTLPPRERRPEFGRLIAALADAMGDRLRILITLRSDHLNLVGAVEGLGPMIRPPEAQFNLKQPADLAEIVRGPLTLAGHREEKEQDTLIGLLRKELSDRPGHLALAQMTLSLAWRDQKIHGGLLGAYAANGGARAALGNEAERIEGVLSPDDTARLMPIFIRLIRLSEIDTGATRRIAAREEFDADQNRLISRLAGERLGKDQDDLGRLVQTSAAHVEIAHEALITQWPRLHEYLIEHAGALRTLSDLMRRAQDWAAAGESAKHLTSLADEERFQALRQAQGAWLAPVERRFLDWSRAEHQRIRDERKAEAKARADTLAKLEAETREKAMVVSQLRAETEAKATALFGREKAIASGKLAIKIGLGVAAVLLSGLLIAGWFAFDWNKQAAQSRVDALALLALSQAETSSVDALKLVLGAWPRDEAGPFPAPSVAFPAISTALANTRPYTLMHGHEGGVVSVAVTTDGSRIVSGGEDGTLRLWDATTGAALGEPLRGHEGVVFAVSPDGSRVISGGEDGTLRLWDVTTGAVLGEPLIGHEDWVRSVQFSPDGSRIVSGGDDYTLRQWDAATGEPLGNPMHGHDGAVFSVAFSSDGSRIVSGGSDARLRMWDATTGDALGEPLLGHQGGVHSVAFSPGGRRIVSGGEDATLRMWDAATGEALGEPLRGHEGWVNSVAFSPDGTRIVSGSGFGVGSNLGEIRQWDAATDVQLGATLRAFEGGVFSVVFSSTGHHIVGGGADGALRLWDATSGTALAEPLVGHEDWVLSVAFSPDGRRIVSGGEDGTLRLWDATTGVALAEPLRGHEARVNSVAFSPEGGRIVSGGEDGTLRLWDAAAGAALGEPLRGHEGSVSSVAFSPDVSRIVSGGQDGTLRLWDATTGIALGEPQRGHEREVRRVAFSPDGTLIASGGWDGAIHIWESDSLQFIRTIHTLRRPRSAFTSIAFSSNGEMIVASDNNGDIRVWETQSGSELTHIVQADGNVVVVAEFSRDDRQIVSAGVNDGLRFWDVATGYPLSLPLRGHTRVINSLAHSPSEEYIVSGSNDNTLRLWRNLPPGNILQVACRYLPHINGRPDTSTDGLAAEIGIEGLTLPEDCDTYDPPLPPEFRR